MTPDIKLDNISLNAKPNANPVSPRPATIADTFIPIVPSAVMSPIITMKFLTILAITLETLVSGFAACNKFLITYCMILLKNQNNTKFIIPKIILGV